MGAGLVVVDAIGAEQAPDVSLVEYDDVVEDFSPDGADDALGEGVLPRRSWRADDLLESESGDGVSDEGVEDAISVAVKEAEGRVKREGVEQLAPCPFRGWMLSDVDVADVAAAVIQDYEAVEDSEGGRGDSEEIDSDRSTEVVVEERPPGLRGWRRERTGMYRATVDWPTENPSFSSSPWILGAPQFGLARAISAMRRRRAASFRGRPNGTRDFHFQKRRKPCRCQRTTVSGLTMRRTRRQRGQTWERQDQKALSMEEIGG